MASKDRRGRRKGREQRSKRPILLGNYFIFTDGKYTEKYYLQGLRESLPEPLQSRIVIKVKQENTYKLVESCQNLVTKELQYAEPWIVLDRDQVKDFDDLLAEAKKASIQVGWSNPCIETWFSVYFGKMLQKQDSVTCCREFEKLFLKHTGKTYQKADTSIYASLLTYGNEEKAIKRAKETMQKHLENDNTKASTQIPATTLYVLVQEIRQKAK